MKIFDLEGPFQRYGTIVFDIIVVNLLWILLTFFTFGILSGPATTGAYAALYSGVITSEGYTFKQFFKRFKRRFVQSLLFGIVNAIAVGLSLFNLYMILYKAFGSAWMLPIYLFVLIEISFVFAYVYPLLAHSSLSMRDVLKYSFFIANRHLPTTVLASFLNGIIVGLCLLIFFRRLLSAVHLHVCRSRRHRQHQQLADHQTCTSTV